MRSSISLILALIAFSYNANSQNMITPAPIGFDIVLESIPHGKIDTITYFSKTVGSKRKALIYIPPGFSKEKNILYFTYYMALVVTKKNGLTVVSHRLFWITCMPKIKLCQ